jgi:hypothetical protein
VLGKRQSPQIKDRGKVVPVVMKTYERMEVKNHAFLTVALYGGEWRALRTDRFTPWIRGPGTYWRGGWVTSGANLDVKEKRNVPLRLPEVESLFPSRPCQ